MKQPVAFGKCVSRWRNSIFSFHWVLIHLQVVLAWAATRQCGFSYNAKRLRPFARRRLMMRLPALVAIRERKPWFRALLILLGWNVLFIFLFLYILSTLCGCQSPKDAVYAQYAFEV
jgi:hypothetical protein